MTANKMTNFANFEKWSKLRTAVRSPNTSSTSLKLYQKACQKTTNMSFFPHQLCYRVGFSYLAEANCRSWDARTGPLKFSESGAWIPRTYRALSFPSFLSLCPLILLLCYFIPFIFIILPSRCPVVLSYFLLMPFHFPLALCHFPLMPFHFSSSFSFPLAPVIVPLVPCRFSPCAPPFSSCAKNFFLGPLWDHLT